MWVGGLLQGRATWAFVRSCVAGVLLFNGRSYSVLTCRGRARFCLEVTELKTEQKDATSPIYMQLVLVCQMQVGVGIRQLTYLVREMVFTVL